MREHPPYYTRFLKILIEFLSEIKVESQVKRYFSHSKRDQKHLLTTT